MVEILVLIWKNVFYSKIICSTSYLEKKNCILSVLKVKISQLKFQVRLCIINCCKIRVFKLSLLYPPSSLAHFQFSIIYIFPP